MSDFERSMGSEMPTHAEADESKSVDLSEVGSPQQVRSQQTNYLSRVEKIKS